MCTYNSGDSWHNISQNQVDVQCDVVNIQWFPGHMTKTQRTIRKELYFIDIVIEILDARAPMSSANPDLSKIIGDRPKLILLNKFDLADPVVTDKWLSYLKNIEKPDECGGAPKSKTTEKQVDVLLVDCKTGRGLGKIEQSIQSMLPVKFNGVVRRPIRAMIVGIPNVGKSFFINRMAQSKKTKVENRPGVTRGKQWISVSDNLEFLDTPGVLWPKFEDKSVGEKLALLGSIRDDILNLELLVVKLLSFLFSHYKQNVVNRYEITEELAENLRDTCDFYQLLEFIGKKRRMFVSGGRVDLQRVSTMILDEFRNGKLGKISLDLFV